MTDKIFDKLVKEIREEEASSEQVKDATERVLKKLTGSSQACAGIQSQLPDYADGKLTESRRLLVDDHLSRCVGCRHTLAGIKGREKVVHIPETKTSPWNRWMRWAAAAAVLVMALYMGRGQVDSLFAPSEAGAKIVSLSGDIYRLPQEHLPVGSTIKKDEVIRTARGGRAILELNDGSRVELNERTELAVHTAWSGDTIRLNRGDIMVQAARQKRGSLRVVTSDSVVSVKGTIFSVSSGTAGSLVSVVEGSVAVSQAGSDKLLTVGQQASTSTTMGNVAINDAISWSQNADKYNILLDQFIRIGKELADIPGPAPRTGSDLLSYMPSGTMAYIAIPNLDNPILQVMDLIEDYAAESSVLEEWWVSGEGQKLKKVLEQVQVFTQLLDDEVVFLLTDDLAAGQKVPLVMARILPDSESDLWTALDDIFRNSSDIPYDIIDGLLLISGTESQLESLVPLLGSGASSPFAAEINKYYEQGVTCLVGVDAGALTEEFKDSIACRAAGLSNMQYVFFELGSKVGQDATRAVMTFQGNRSGVLSWLAPPASNGSIEYISSDALAVVSASTRDPRDAFEELLDIVGADSKFIEEIDEFESVTGVRIGDDIASSFGTDFTVALEQLTLPVPGFVGVFEVIYPETLDSTIRRLVDSYNEWLPPEKNSARLIYTQEIDNGLTWNSLKSSLSIATVYWTYDQGYMIVSLDRALVSRAISIRDSGLQLTNSAKFQQCLPVSAGLHSSGLYWLDNNKMMNEVASLIDNPVFNRMIDSGEPSLVMVSAEDQQIRITSHSRLRLTNLFLGSMLSSIPQKQE